MARWSGGRDLRAIARAEWDHLVRFQASDRNWRMPLAAALASGAPLLIGVWLGRPDFGLVSSLGGMVFLYLPETPLDHRMVTIMACAFAMIGSYALGVISHFFPPLQIPALTFVAALTTMVCRYFRLPPPGCVFFVMAAAIGMYTPAEALETPTKVGLLALGALLACLIAFFYSLAMMRLRPPQPAPPPASTDFDFVVVESLAIGAFIGASLALAQALHLERAYWAPVSCAAIVQSSSLRAVWTRQFHRIWGTGAGLLLTWALLGLPLGPWGTAAVMTALAFVIETLVVRHYGLASAFITPMAIFLAESGGTEHASASALIAARFLDTLLGCAVGLVGGLCLHSERFRPVIGGVVRRALGIGSDPDR
jgi:uncharacterized membrane protein YccC